MNINNYPLELPKANYFGAESQISGWTGGHNNWAYSVGGQFQTPQQKEALFGKEEDIKEPNQIAMARTSEGLQKIPDTEQQMDSKPGGMLEGIEVSETPDPMAIDFETTQARIEPNQPQ